MQQDPLCEHLLRQARETRVASMAEYFHEAAVRIDLLPLRVGSLELCSTEKTPESEFEGEESEEDSEEEESSPPSVYSAPTEYYGEGEEEEESPPLSVCTAPTEYYGEGEEEEEHPPPSEYSDGEPYTEDEDSEPCMEEEEDLSPPPSEYSRETVRGRRGWKEELSPYPSEGSTMDWSRGETLVKPMIWHSGGEEEDMEEESTVLESRSGERTPGGGEALWWGSPRRENERRQCHPAARSSGTTRETGCVPVERAARASASRAPDPPIDVGSGHLVLLVPRDG
ncbi:uncharacterized protein LOC143522605 [Brachyhypopomus gauderio]|uniref:uncharacterized protein LOC143522605 n=1 Tax=Brachyhypopomus gauderio TaxID=698409 RepID=UPI0040422434